MKMFFGSNRLKGNRILVLFVMAAVLLLAASGCSGAGSDGADAVSDGGNAYEEQWAETTPYDAYYESGSVLDESAAYSMPAPTTSAESASAGSGSTDGSASTGQGSAVSSDRKEIKTGTATITVDDVSAAYTEISKLVDDLGGYEFSKNENNEYSTARIYLTVKIPPAKLKAFESSLFEIVGEDAIRQYQVNSQDITAAYQDSAARLESMRASLEQYLRLLEKAQSVEEILAIQREITSLQATIDSLDGQIRMWDRLVEYATMELSLYSADAPIDQTWQFNTASEVFNEMGNGFIVIARGFGNTLLWILIAIVSLLPVLVPIGIVVFVIVRVRRKRRRRRAAAAPPVAANGFIGNPPYPGAQMPPYGAQTPAETHAPGGAQAHGSAQAHGATQEPIGTQAPAATQEPAATQAPAGTQAPAATEATLPEDNRTHEDPKGK